MRSSLIYGVYEKLIDRESAFEILSQKQELLEEERRQAEEEKERIRRQKEGRRLPLKLSAPGVPPSDNERQIRHPGRDARSGGQECQTSDYNSTGTHPYAKPAGRHFSEKDKYNKSMLTILFKHYWLENKRSRLLPQPGSNDLHGTDGLYFVVIFVMLGFMLPHILAEQFGQ